MKSVKNILALFILSIIFYGCKKETLVTNVNYNFIGNWRCSNWDDNDKTGRKIQIDNHSIFTFTEYENGEVVKLITGTATLQNDKMTVEKKLGYKSYHIDAFPAYDSNGNYSMELDGIVYVH
jgi:hypothetical protein